ncbi:signal recognition particle-docking protein FtsY [Lichenifustis flavocetrariae]|uniref:Signal recognition particle receptor FtsY n=1 Tax=Lichenifustis flavocetrariae TaxID=2949735 RepID=A0AA41Z3M6_9HYPH|nr:signal recognition particle-docking protein FtsY [Lichenifustis flavocetrariae]MCW6508667.1 signal recognition particle-docking protein FtsY [Lichenifustis flavocetrariae]
MSAEDTDRKRPGFFRRFFGGATAPAEPELPPDDEVELLTPEQELVERTAVTGPIETAVTPADLIEVFDEPAETEGEAAPPPVPDRMSAPASEERSLPSPDSTRESGDPEPTGWLSRLRKGLSRSSSSLGQGLTGIFTKRRLELSTVEDLEDLLIQADLGVTTALRIVDTVRDGRFTKGVGAEDVQAIIANHVERVLDPVAKPLVITGPKPFVILVIGVNGSGKTTTIGKLAAKFTREGRSVMLAAGDTFRAAAVEQLKVWGARIGIPVVSGEAGADAAGLAFDAFKSAQAAGTDVLLIDTAGRLQNRAELMDELAKVLRVIRKIDADAPHAVLLVLDATVGQNAMSQVEIFGRVAGVTGLVMTKLDGTARGGILVAIAEKFKVPVHFIGVGEGVDDLEPFAARDFARAIAGLER